MGSVQFSLRENPMVEDRCTKPPLGWSCTREPGHEGPCAAIQNLQTPVDTLMEPTDDQVLAITSILTALVFGSVIGLVVLVFVGFASSILGFVFGGILGLVPGFLWGRLGVKQRKRKHAVPQVRPPDAARTEPEVHVQERGA